MSEDGDGPTPLVRGILDGMTKAEIYVFVVVLIIGGTIVGWLLVRAELGEVAMLALGGVIGLVLWGLVVYSLLRKPTDKDE